MLKYIFSIILIVIIIASLVKGGSIFTASKEVATPKVLAEREFSLENRYGDAWVNGVFRDNILLTIDYLAGSAIDPKNIDWEKINTPATYKLTLKPGETFAFHDDVLPEYQNRVSKTSNAHFNAVEGFKFSGALWGDGVCHLASFIYWAALDAELDTYAPTRHDFAQIPEVPRNFGVSIYATPGTQKSDQVQNLYITNDRENEITFEFAYDGKNLKISVLEEIENERLAVGELN